MEFENLEKKHAELESELQSLTEKEKALNENVKTLEVEVAIQKLEEKIRAKRKSVERLNSKKKKLEKELEEPETSKITEEPRPEDAEKVEGQETDVMVTVAPVESQEPAQSQEEREEKKEKSIFSF